jgi:hypothetical protein
MENIKDLRVNATQPGVLVDERIIDILKKYRIGKTEEEIRMSLSYTIERSVEFDSMIEELEEQIYLINLDKKLNDKDAEEKIEDYPSKKKIKPIPASYNEL